MNWPQVIVPALLPYLPDLHLLTSLAWYTSPFWARRGMARRGQAWRGHGND